MHSKTKSTLSGLAAVAVFVLGGALLGEPIPDTSGLQAGPPLGDIGTEPVAQALELGAGRGERSAREGNRRRLHLTMPYVSIGQLLARES